MSRRFLRKVNSFLDKMNPTEAQMASYIDLMCEKLWPEPPSAAAASPRSEEEKSESRERAHSLISARCESSQLPQPWKYPLTTIDFYFVPRFQLHHTEEDGYGNCF